MNKFILIFWCVLFSFDYSIAQKSETVVLVETSFGNIKIKLYNETPLHRDNFIKLVEKHFYDSLLFHRVINTFMIQGGDPDSKNAPAGKFLGDGDVGYTISAEFNQKLFHKRGVLAAARNGDEVNPEQASSGCQFYIVQGKIFTDSLLSIIENRITRMKAYNKVVRNKNNKTLFDNLNMFMQIGEMDSVKIARAKIEQLTDLEMPNITPYKFSDEQRKIYTTVGGTPHLDGSYTVFGEVIEGMDVVDKIAAVPVDRFARPLTDVRMKISIIK
jgi:cyclophilin family peptidyl-prolyl cis-trans isomerase